jgi:hypothetical protein
LDAWTLGHSRFAACSVLLRVGPCQCETWVTG